MFRKVLVANRGEIAVRLIRGLREAGVQSVAVYSDADRASLHVQIADEAAYVGPAAASESYLRIGNLLDAARAHGAEAIHPGYGFLSENADFAEACAGAGIVFIGPSASAIRKLGSKTAARQLAMAAGAPVVPGTESGVTDENQALKMARKIGFPVLLKASAGGGGKGMRRVDREEDLAGALRDASSEAARSFGNGEVYIEKLILEPRHIEIQILGDQHGNPIHLGERECSVQRRHQKVIEECPSPVMLEFPELRSRMGAAALKIARAAEYTNAGTVEFLVDREHNFYFLEVNTRLQVEHPVTELATGIDLVQWQLRIAAGEHLDISQKDVHWTGSAMECRIYAEDHLNNYMPSPGKLQKLREPAGPGIRLDSGVYEGWNVPIEYDPLLAKLAVWAPSREAAMNRMQRALGEYVVGGIRTNLRLFSDILRDEQFRAGHLSTAFLDHFLERLPPSEDNLEGEAAAALVLALNLRKNPPTSSRSSQKSTWLEMGRQEQLR